MAGKVYLGNTFIGYSEKRILSTYGGLMISPGPMYLTSGGEYGICNTYDEYCSFGVSETTTVGYKDGYKTYFSLSQLGVKFDSNYSSESDYNNSLASSGVHTINNQGDLVSYNGYDDWRLPSSNELSMLIFPYDINYNTNPTTVTVKRPGSTVNNIANVHSAFVILQKENTYCYPTTYNNLGPCVFGVLIFPDEQTITGADIFKTTDSYTSSTNYKSPSYGFVTSNVLAQTTSYWPVITESELNSYLNQGCTFIPNMGRWVMESSYGVWINWKIASTNSNYTYSTWQYCNKIFGSISNQLLTSVFYWDTTDCCIDSNLDLTTTDGGLTRQRYCSYNPVFLVRGTSNYVKNEIYVFFSKMGSMYIGGVNSVGEDWNINDLTSNPPKLYINATLVNNPSWSLSGTTLTVTGSGNLDNNDTLKAFTLTLTPASYPTSAAIST